MEYPVGGRGHTGSVKAHPSSQRPRRGRRDGGLRGPVLSAASRGQSSVPRRRQRL